MKDKIIWTSCLLLFLSGVVVGYGFSFGYEKAMSYIASYATVIGGLFTVITFLWAFYTYRDWRKTKSLNEYDALREVGRASNSLLISTYYLLDAKIQPYRRSNNATEKQDNHRNKRIEYLETRYDEGMTNYDNNRFELSLLGNQMCPQSDLEILDDIVRAIERICWLARSETLIVTDVEVGTYHPKEGELPKGAQTVIMDEGILIPSEIYKHIEAFGLKRGITPKYFYSEMSKILSSHMRKILSFSHS